MTGASLPSGTPDDDFWHCSKCNGRKSKQVGAAWKCTKCGCDTTLRVNAIIATEHPRTLAIPASPPSPTTPAPVCGFCEMAHSPRHRCRLVGTRWEICRGDMHEVHVCFWEPWPLPAARCDDCGGEILHGDVGRGSECAQCGKFFGELAELPPTTPAKHLNDLLADERRAVRSRPAAPEMACSRCQRTVTRSVDGFCAACTSELNGAAAPQGGEPHPESICDACGGPNVVWFAPNDLWNRVVGSPNGILCPTCFIRAAERCGVEAVWRVDPDGVSLSDIRILALFARGVAKGWYGSDTQMEPPLAAAERALASISPPGGLSATARPESLELAVAASNASGFVVHPSSVAEENVFRGAPETAPLTDDLNASANLWQNKAQMSGGSSAYRQSLWDRVARLRALAGRPVEAPGGEPKRLAQVPNGCWLACIASLTDIPHDELTALLVHQGDEHWKSPEFHNAVSQLMRERGWRLAYIGADVPRGYAIGSGMSPRGVMHATITKDGALWHDPHPSGEGVESFTDFEVVLPIRPLAATTEVKDG